MLDLVRVEILVPKVSFERVSIEVCMLSITVNHPFWSFSPVVSTPLGVYHITVGLISAVEKSCQIASYLFRIQLNGEDFVQERQIAQIVTKKDLQEAVGTIALGILETVPFIGNFAICLSTNRQNEQSFTMLRSPAVYTEENVAIEYIKASKVGLDLD